MAMVDELQVVFVCRNLRTPRPLRALLVLGQRREPALPPHASRDLHLLLDHDGCHHSGRSLITAEFGSECVLGFGRATRTIKKRKRKAERRGAKDRNEASVVFL